MINELRKRFEEIEKASKADFSKGRNVKAFYGKIADYINAVEKNDAIKRRLSKLREDKTIKSLDEELINKGEEILQDLRNQLALVKAIISEKKVELPSYREVYGNRPSGVAFSMSVTESLGSGIETLGRQLDEMNNVDISQISNIASSFYGVVMDMHYLGIANLELYPGDFGVKVEKHQALLNRRQRQQDFLGLNQYDDLVQIRDALDDDGESMKGIGFKFKESYQSAKATASDWLQPSDLPKVQKERLEYLEKAQKANGLVQDLLNGNFQRLKKYLFTIEEYWQLRVVRDATKYIFSITAGFILGINWLNLWNQFLSLWHSLLY